MNSSLNQPQDAAPKGLRIRDLTITYTVRGKGGFGRRRVSAVRGVDLDLLPGETLGIVGESGSGKTSIGRAVLGLLDVESGTIHFDETDLTAAPRPFSLALRRVIQAVLQDPWSSFNPRRQISKTLDDVLRRHTRLSKQERAARIAELLTAVGLPVSFADRYPGELSGGQRQRVSIARALAVSPRVIICDEIVSALDVSSQAQILDLLMDLQARTGVSLLFISHDLAVVRDICDRIAVMREGEIVEVGDTDAIFENPNHPYTRELIGAIPGARIRTASAGQKAAEE